MNNVLLPLMCTLWTSTFDWPKQKRAHFVYIRIKYISKWFKHTHTHSQPHPYSYASCTHNCLRVCVWGKHAGMHNNEENICWHSLFHAKERRSHQHQQAIHLPSHALHTYACLSHFYKSIVVCDEGMKNCRNDGDDGAATAAAMKTTKISKKSENTTTSWKLCGFSLCVDCQPLALHSNNRRQHTKNVMRRSLYSYAVCCREFYFRKIIRTKYKIKSFVLFCAENGRASMGRNGAPSASSTYALRAMRATKTPR